jgi:shikimate 5-dehydrogenase
VALSPAVVVGAGGVAGAIAYGHARRGAEVFVCARDPEQAAALAAGMGLAGAASLHEQGRLGAVLVVNATLVSAPSGGPVDLGLHQAAGTLLDVAFRDRRTPLAAEAERRGWPVAPGRRMLLHQAAEFRLYTGLEPPLATMAAVLEATL